MYDGSEIKFLFGNFFSSCETPWWRNGVKPIVGKHREEQGRLIPHGEPIALQYMLRVYFDGRLRSCLSSVHGWWMRLTRVCKTDDSPLDISFVLRFVWLPPGLFVFSSPFAEKEELRVRLRLFFSFITDDFHVHILFIFFLLLQLKVKNINKQWDIIVEKRKKKKADDYE